jgi:5-methylthioribose kinase
LAVLRPAQFFLDADDRDGLQCWMLERGWISVSENVLSAARAGEGNMNYTLRVQTNERSFILKQARPWVEKYPSIDAPDERAVVEANFYRAIRLVQVVASRMPAMLAADETARMLMIEDLTPAHDCTDLYAGAPLSAADLASLVTYLKSLQTIRGTDLPPVFANRAMRSLNHEHIFDLPIRKSNGLQLDAITPGLQATSEELRADERYCRRVTELGKIYLSDGSSLAHGDFFPGSWMRSQAGLRVIDPEFCFVGVPEFDFGVFLAHLHLAGIEADVDTGDLDRTLVKGFAGTEIMRRLIGVAQLPVRFDIDEKRRLLELSRTLVLQ